MILPPPERQLPVKLARNISYAMTVAGVSLILIAALLDLPAGILLTGMLLFVAGIIKIAMVAIWGAFFALPMTEPGSSTTQPSREKQEA